MNEITLSKEAKSLKPGIYKHYKGKRYQVLGVTIHSETLEEMVHYKALYDDKLEWVRPLEMFTEEIEVDGVRQKRFKFLSGKA